MKHVKLNAYQVALVFKNGGYQKMLTAGNYWFWKNEKVFVYDINEPFVAPVELNILLKDPLLQGILEVVMVKDNEIVLLYENGLLKQVLTPGRYAYWKSDIVRKYVLVDLTSTEMISDIEPMLLAKHPLNAWVRSFEVQNHERALLFIADKYVLTLQPGLYHWWKNSTPVHIAKADIRQQQLEMNGQEILTRDKAALRINGWAQYKLEDIEKAVLENKEYDKQLYVIFQLALREYVAGYGFDELLEKKDGIASFVLQHVKDKAVALGIGVSGFGIRDIILPGDVKEIMNQVLIAEKKAQANSIIRREETASTRSLLNTAKLMEENAMLWKLKEIEYVEKIAEKISTISVGGNGQLLEQLKQILVGK